MNISIISGKIFPAISARAFRATELAKELSRQGHQVTLYAVLGKYDYTEFCQESNITIKPIKTFFNISDSDGNNKTTLWKRVLIKLFRYPLEFPDIELMWKIPDIIKKSNDIDLLITIAVPYPIHWGAAICKFFSPHKFPKIWISDCGDPYMGDSVNKHPIYFHILERLWLNLTDYITIPIEAARTAYHCSARNKIRIIPQGININDYPICSKPLANEPIRFAYAGTIYPNYRDPSLFLEYLTKVKDDFVFTVYTNQFRFYERFKKALGDKLLVKSFVSRKQLIYELSQQDFLINLLNQSEIQSPSKLIDYGISRRPILDVSTKFTQHEDFHSFLNRNYKGQKNFIDLSKFEISHVASQFLQLADRTHHN